MAVSRWNEELCRFLVLDPETGVSGAETPHEFGGYLDGGAWLNERAYTTIHGALRVVDKDNSEIDYSWSYKLCTLLESKQPGVMHGVHHPLHMLGKVFDAFPSIGVRQDLQ